MKAKKAMAAQCSVRAARGNPACGGKVRQSQTVSESLSVEPHEPTSLLRLVQDGELVDKVHGCLTGFKQRNVEYELHKATALKIMITALHD